MTWVFQIVLFLMISGVFFLWIFLFAVRVFLIQILAILAPLAFICLILPQTRKYWDDWLKHLISWTFLGIFLLFFFAIGIRAANALVPPGGLTPIPFDWGSIAAYFTYYFFLFIYLILVSYVSSRFMPALATFIISQAKSWGGVAWGRAIKPFGEVFKKSAERVWKEKAEAPVRKRLERAPMIGRALGGPGAYEAELKRRTATQRKKIEDRSTEALQEIVEMRPVTAEDRHTRAAAMEILAEKGKLKEAYRTHLAEVKSYGGDTGEIMKAMPHWAPEVGKEIRKDVVEKEPPREFRRKTQPEALEKPEVVVTLDVAKFRDIARHGSTAQKKAIAETLRTRQRELAAELYKLLQQGLTEEFRKAHKALAYAGQRPEFQR